MTRVGSQAMVGSSRNILVTRLYRDAETRGNLIPDAWFAALAIESGCEWITLDRDFARFKELRWSRPPRLADC